MGYCPYICILCRDIEDNGWSNLDLFSNLDRILEDKGYKIHNKKETYEGYPLTNDVCDSCLRKIIKEKGEKLYKEKYDKLKEKYDELIMKTKTKNDSDLYHSDPDSDTDPEDAEALARYDYYTGTFF